MVSYADICRFSQNLTMPLRLSRDDARDSTRFNEEVTRALPGRAIPSSLTYSTMVSYADICRFSQNLTMPIRLSRDDARDSTRFNEEVTRALPGRAPRYDGQYHIDFWLSKVEDSFALLHLPEEEKCKAVTKVFFEDVFKAYDAMQQSRIHRGEAAIKDWPTLKAILRCVFLPLTQLDTTLVNLPSPDDPVSDLSRKTDSLSLLPSSSSSCSNTKKVDFDNMASGRDGFEFMDKLHDEDEREVLKEMIDASQQKLKVATIEIQDLLDASENKLEWGTRYIQDLLDETQVKLVLATQEIQDLLAQCSTMLSPPPMAKTTTTLKQEARANSSCK